MPAIAVSLSEALSTPERKVSLGSPQSTCKSPKKCLDLDSMIEKSPLASSLEPRKVELTGVFSAPIAPPPAAPPKLELPSAIFANAGLIAPPPALPPSLPNALSNEPASPPPSLPASMPLAPAPAIEAVEVPAPPSKPPAISEELEKQPKLQLPSMILRYSPEPSETCGSSDCDEETPFGQSRSGVSVKFPPGLKPPPNTPSHGSVLHEEGSCRPCAWFWKSSGCKNGVECGHCHLCPEGEIKSRKKSKQTIMRLGLATPKVSATAADVCDPSPDAFALRQSCETVLPAFPKTDEEEDADIDALLSAACAPSALDVAGTSDGNESSTTGAGSEQELSSDASHGSPRCATPSAIVTFPPGLEEKVKQKALPSQGSKLHGSGACRPCAWFYKPGSCENSADCKYCHICPQGELKTRKKSKNAIMRMGLATPKADDESVQKAKFELSLESLL